MHAKIASLVLLGLGTADILTLNLFLAPRLARLEESPAPASLRIELTAPPPPELTAARQAAGAPVQPASLQTRPAASERARAASDIEFSPNSTRIERLTAFRELRQVIQRLSQDPDRQLLLRGHSDPLGPPSYNLALGRKRAEAVKRYLTDRGAPADRIALESVGSAELIDPRPTPVAWARNRRVEVLWR